MNFYNLYKFAVGCLPVLGLMINKIKLNGWEWFAASELVILGLTLTNWFFGEKDRLLITFYGGFMAIFLLLITLKLGHHHFNQALSITLLLSYVLTEYWEIPVFFCGFLGLFGKTYHGPVNQIYLLVTIILLLQVSKLKINTTNLLYFLTPLSMSGLVLLSYPAIQYAGSFWYLSRGLCFMFLGSLFLMESKP